MEEIDVENLKLFVFDLNVKFNLVRWINFFGDYYVLKYCNKIWKCCNKYVNYYKIFLLWWWYFCWFYFIIIKYLFVYRINVNFWEKV